MVENVNATKIYISEFWTAKKQFIFLLIINEFGSELKFG